MTVVNPPAWLQQATYPARTDRLVTASLVATSGRCTSGDLVVTQSATPGMRVTVSAGRAWILGTSISYQGAYNLVNDSSIDVTIAASSTLNPRKDLVVARVQDAAVSGSINLGSIEVVTGTAAASPVLPTQPSNSIILAVITVPANASSIVTANIDSSMSLVATLFSEMANTTVICTSTTRPTGSNRYRGVRILETDTLREWMWDGARWSYRGGGPGPYASIGTVSTIGWGITAGAGLIYNMSPEAGLFDTNYFSYVNSASFSVGDRIKVTQSGRYAIQVAVFSDRVGPYYVQARADFSPSNGHTIPHQADANIGGWGKQAPSYVEYLNAGTEIAIELYMNQPGTVLAAARLTVQLIP